MEPDKYTPGKGKLSSQSHHFQVRAVNLRGCNKKKHHDSPNDFICWPELFSWHGGDHLTDGPANVTPKGLEGGTVWGGPWDFHGNGTSTVRYVYLPTNLGLV